MSDPYLRDLTAQIIDADIAFSDGRLTSSASAQNFGRPTTPTLLFYLFSHLCFFSPCLSAFSALLACSKAVHIACFPVSSCT